MDVVSVSERGGEGISGRENFNVDSRYTEQRGGSRSGSSEIVEQEFWQRPEPHPRTH